MVKVAEIKLSEISEDNINRYFGYDDSHPPSPRTEALMIEEKKWLLDNAKPRGIYGIFPCSFPDRRTTLIGNELFESVVLNLHLKGSKAACILAITMGENVDTQISRLMDEGSMARGYVLNGLAAAMADCAADALEVIFKEEIGPHGSGAGLQNLDPHFLDVDWKTTLRFSPGYADLILENQAAIFRLITPEKIGMSLTGSFLIKPIKSITAIIGIGPDVKTDEYPCELCDRCNVTNCKFIEDS